MNTETMFSSKSNEWETPDELFKLLDEEFHFTLDPSATKENHKCKKYYTRETNGLSKSWEGEIVFMNPPYSREIVKWMKKAYIESYKGRCVVVCLVPARTDTKWFHHYCQGSRIRFLKGRLKFVNRTLPSWRADGNYKLTGAPFPSMIVIMGNPKRVTNPSLNRKYKYVEYGV